MDYNLPELIIIKREIMPYVKITGKITVSILYLSKYATLCFAVIICGEICYANKIIVCNSRSQ